VTANPDESIWHDRAILTYRVLVSDDELGVIRVWDPRQGCCARVVHPGSLSALVEHASGASKSKFAAKNDASSSHVDYCKETRSTRRQPVTMVPCLEPRSRTRGQEVTMLWKHGFATAKCFQRPR
jgi:hypothetical protein